MPNKRRRLTGQVISDKMDKTVVVAVDTTKLHPLYGKYIRTTKKYLAHDESNSIPVGSTVRIVESKPISKRKRWAVEEIIHEISQVAAEAAASVAEAPEAAEVVAEMVADEPVAEVEAVVEEVPAVEVEAEAEDADAAVEEAADAADADDAAESDDEE